MPQDTTSMLSGFLPIASKGVLGIPESFGILQNAKANQKYGDYIKQRQFELKDIFNNQYNTPFLDTEEAKSVIRAMLDQMKDVSEDTKSSSKITGASAEKEVAQKDKMQENFTDTLTRLAGIGTRRKEGILNTYMGQQNNLDSMNLNWLGHKADQANQLRENADQLTQSLLMTFATGGGSALGSATGGKNPKNTIPQLGNAPVLGNAPNLTGYRSMQDFLQGYKQPTTFLDFYKP